MDLERVSFKPFGNQKLNEWIESYRQIKMEGDDMMKRTWKNIVSVFFPFIQLWECSGVFFFSGRIGPDLILTDLETFSISLEDYDDFHWPILFNHWRKQSLMTPVLAGLSCAC